MGGLISFYAGLYYPGVFGRIGVFSPAFWLNAALKEEIKKAASKRQQGYQHYYFYAGGKESAQMVPDMQAVMAEMEELASPQIDSFVNPDGKHSEAYWRAAFPAFYKFISAF
jgi:predicted alpha/beta superfamily hydrolase